MNNVVLCIAGQEFTQKKMNAVERRIFRWMCGTLEEIRLRMKIYEVRWE